MRNHVSRYLTALIAVGCAATTAACTSLPSNSEPQALRSFEASASEEPQGPVEDQEPDLLLRDFYEANNNPQQRYSLARRYLTHRALFHNDWLGKGRWTVANFYLAGSNCGATK